MRGVHLPGSAAYLHPRAQQPALLVPVRPGQGGVLPVGDREGRQDRVAELAWRCTGNGRPEVDIGPVDDVHTQLAGQPPGLVDEATALTEVPVDLLQTDDVHVGGPDHPAGAREVDPPVYALAVLDVERHDARRPGRHLDIRRHGYRPWRYCSAIFAGAQASQPSTTASRNAFFDTFVSWMRTA